MNSLHSTICWPMISPSSVPSTGRKDTNELIGMAAGVITRLGRCILGVTNSFACIYDDGLTYSYFDYTTIRNTTSLFFTCIVLRNVTSNDKITPSVIKQSFRLDQSRNVRYY